MYLIIPFKEYYSAIKRNEIELFAVRWMDLETVMQSEVNQKERNKCHMLTHIYGTKRKKKVLRNLGQDRNKDTDVESGLGDSGKGKGGLGQSERVAWTYIHYQM